MCYFSAFQSRRGACVKLITTSISSGASSRSAPYPSIKPVQNPDGQESISSEIDTQDIENLIAFASAAWPASLQPRATEDRLSSRDLTLVLLLDFISSVQQELGFAKVLDSIAPLSIAAPQHGVIAVALSMTCSEIEPFSAGNHEVPQGQSATYANYVWWRNGKIDTVGSFFLLAH